MSRKRSRARSHAVQALYQWQVTGQDIATIVDQFLAAQDPRKFEVSYFRDLVHGVPGQVRRLDEALQPYLDRPMQQVDLVERAILRLAAYEFVQHPEIPYRVVINESVELAKTYGAEQGHRYVNGVLDKLARILRPHDAGVVSK